jgi:hypothetical protein
VSTRTPVLPRCARLATGVLTGVLAAALAAGPTSYAVAGERRAPAPGSPEYVARDLQNIDDADGRITDVQLANPAYLPALATEIPTLALAQLLEQAASPTRPSITAGAVVPGWNVGNPLRAGWDGTRGRALPVSFTNRFGALLRGTLHAPLPGARDPYTGKRLRPPFPGVVITEGSVQGSENMYLWLAQDLAERGYVVLTYDVQGQGTSQTLPGDGSLDGVPSQQIDNFVVGTQDALTFLLSTPEEPAPAYGATEGEVTGSNPWHALLDRRPDHRPSTAGRTAKIAVVGHSLGAAAISQVQAVDERISTIVALDKLGASVTEEGVPVEPVVPALAIQSEYGFTVSPWFLSGGSSLSPEPTPEGPAPTREKETGFDAWRAAGVDSLLVVPRASTHLEYTDIPLALPASRWGQALTSAYTQRWLDHYLKNRPLRPLLAQRMRYLEPVGGGQWDAVVLERDPLLSFYYCSAMHLAGGAIDDGDLTDVGC